MLCNAKTLFGFTLESINGEIGIVKDFYFDDRLWTIRYVVAAIGPWLVTRQVLISPHALLPITKADFRISVNLTKQQIEESPSIDHDMPVSRQFEQDYHSFYRYPRYWHGLHT